MDEETFRAAVDERGLLRANHGLTPPDPSQAYVVFAQRSDARFEIKTLAQHAERFFGTTISLVVPKHYAGHYPDVDAALVSIQPSTVPAGLRFCYGRPRSERDLDAAQAAEMRAGYTGLFDLARRCHFTWLVAVESEADRTALLCAAILASVVLGPILSPGGSEIFGVRTARMKLEEGLPTYRR
jgi:hypothetical protein